MHFGWAACRKAALFAALALAAASCTHGAPGGLDRSDSDEISLRKAQPIVVATVAASSGTGLDRFPLPIDTDPPHRPHLPITDFAAAERRHGGGHSFRLATSTSPFGLYGRFWTATAPPSPSARLHGVRFVDVRWSGDSQNTFVVLSLMDRRTDDCAAGQATAAVQGLPGQLCVVDPTRSGEDIELVLKDGSPPAPEDILAVIDAENLPLGDPATVYPTSISVDRIEWLWMVPPPPPG